MKNINLNAELIGFLGLIIYGFWMIAILAKNTCNL